MELAVGRGLKWQLGISAGRMDVVGVDTADSKVDDEGGQRR
jgi:hypothetical protein